MPLGVSLIDKRSVGLEYFEKDSGIVPNIYHSSFRIEFYLASFINFTPT